MTDKWADYLISAVRYNTAGTHIDKVQVREDQGEKVGSAEQRGATKVVSSLEADNTFVTIVKATTDKWHFGARSRSSRSRGRNTSVPMRTQLRKTTSEDCRDFRPAISVVYLNEIHMSGRAGHQHVTAVRWRNPSTGACGNSTRTEMVKWIQNGGKVYLRYGKADVKVSVVKANPPYLRSHADGTWNDNLLTLPRYSAMGAVIGLRRA